ncbi:NAD-dependent protein deacetylase [Bowdeniella nasicola]|uniref:protein acetyllysine N-acetyltransferase n=1 Tax=Bowdeniella nasicola TaxID=208480 RepID=A0A1Q5Q369_9ACTO|nr:NAD-dependent protein deacetylase [Bowdeniella nasicola]OKL54139.1 NAD-dependent protein deacetylase [Bowdeniella nasicola]
MESFPTSHPAALAHHSAVRSIQRVVAETAPLQDPAFARAGILDLLRAHHPLVVTGAGVSTDSGIPDYRGPNGSLRRHRPMTYQEFRHDDAARQRYWARSFVGWRQMSRAEPNASHEILAALQRDGLITGIVTQNVDGLHAAAGARGVITLHGDLDVVACLNCGAKENRARLDARLEAANPGYLEAVQINPDLVNPDGDVTLDQEWIDRFHMVDCRACGSPVLKPDIVYFGENVPQAKKDAARELLATSGSVLAIGTSLAVTSGYRFVLDAKAQGKPVGIINGGPTRGDAKADFRWRSDVASALRWLADQL